MGVASGMNTVVRMIGAVIGGQVGAALLTAQTIGPTSIPAESAFTTTFALSAVTALVAAGIAVSIGTQPLRSRLEPCTPDRANVPVVDADPVEIRVLGCLIEKQRTTPDQYPLSLNALRLACNQATNRDPVVDYDEATIRAAIEKLSRRGWIRLASGPGGRVAKYRHLLDDALGRVPSQIALLGVLMLRGAQTPGELKSRGRAALPVRHARGRPARARPARRARARREAAAPAGAEPGPLRPAARRRTATGGGEPERSTSVESVESTQTSARGARRPARGAGGGAATRARRTLSQVDLRGAGGVFIVPSPFPSRDACGEAERCRTTAEGGRNGPRALEAAHLDGGCARPALRLGQAASPARRAHARRPPHAPAGEEPLRHRRRRRQGGAERRAAQHPDASTAATPTWGSRRWA